MPTALPPMPTSSPILQPGLDGKDTPYLDGDWYQYFFTRDVRIQAAPQVLTPARLTAQSASLPATALNVGALVAGLYRLSYYSRITQAASVSSSLTITLNWTDGGVSCQANGVPMTGNTTSTTQSGSGLIHVDGVTSLTFSTTYVSVGGVPMQFSLYVVAELVA